MAVLGRGSGRSSERRQGWKEEAHPPVIRTPLPEVQGLSLPTVGRERTTSSLQPGRGDKGARTGSCLKEPRSEQPGPRPQPPPRAGRSCKNRCKGKEARPLKPKCNGPGVLDQQTGPRCLLCPAADKPLLPQALPGQRARFPGRGSGVFLPYLSHSDTLPDTSWDPR